MKENIGSKFGQKINRLNTLRRVTPVVVNGAVYYRVEGKAPLYASRKEAFRIAQAGPSYAEMCAAQLSNH